MHCCKYDSAFFERSLYFKGIIWSMLIFQEQQLVDFQIGMEIMSWFNSDVLIWCVISNNIKRTEIILSCDSNQIIALNRVHVLLTLSIDWDEAATWFWITMLIIFCNPKFCDYSCDFTYSNWCDMQDVSRSWSWKCNSEIYILIFFDEKHRSLMRDKWEIIRE